MQPKISKSCVCSISVLGWKWPTLRSGLRYEIWSHQSWVVTYSDVWREVPQHQFIAVFGPDEGCKRGLTLGQRSAAYLWHLIKNLFKKKKERKESNVRMPVRLNRYMDPQYSAFLRALTGCWVEVLQLFINCLDWGHHHVIPSVCLSLP